MNEKGEDFETILNRIHLEIEKLTKEMKQAAKILEFEHAAFLRDRIEKLRKMKLK